MPTQPINTVSIPILLKDDLPDSYTNIIDSILLSSIVSLGEQINVISQINQDSTVENVNTDISTDYSTKILTVQDYLNNDFSKIITKDFLNIFYGSIHPRENIFKTTTGTEFLVQENNIISDTDGVLSEVSYIQDPLTSSLENDIKNLASQIGFLNSVIPPTELKGVRREKSIIGVGVYGDNEKIISEHHDGDKYNTIISEKTRLSNKIENFWNKLRSKTEKEKYVQAKISSSLGAFGIIHSSDENNKIPNTVNGIVLKYPKNNTSVQDSENKFSVSEHYSRVINYYDQDGNIIDFEYINTLVDDVTLIWSSPNNNNSLVIPKIINGQQDLFSARLLEAESSYIP